MCSLPVTPENKTVKALQENRKHPNFIATHIIPEITNMQYKAQIHISRPEGKIMILPDFLALTIELQLKISISKCLCLS